MALWNRFKTKNIKLKVSVGFHTEEKGVGGVQSFEKILDTK